MTRTEELEQVRIFDRMHSKIKSLEEELCKAREEHDREIDSFCYWKMINCWHKFVDKQPLWAYKDKVLHIQFGWMTTQQLLTSFREFKKSQDVKS